MRLKLLKLDHFRNLQGLSLEIHPHLNVIYGVNGSGKTSILEGVYYASHGKSFRTARYGRLIHHDEAAFTLFCAYEAEDGTRVHLGVEKQEAGQGRVRLNGETLTSMAEAVKILPVLLICPDSYRLLTAGPQNRRQYLDWGLFHVEHGFLLLWRQWQRLLKQRHAALKVARDYGDVAVWDESLIPVAEGIAAYRESYWQQLKPHVEALLQQFLPSVTVEMTYRQGWAEDASLAEVLPAAFFRDRQLGHSRYGPQRGDILFQVGGKPADEILSRGQQKLLVYALQLSQVILLRTSYDKPCLCLVDDLPAELDSRHLAVLLQQLLSMKAQILMSTIEKDPVLACLPESLDVRVFHVEHGCVDAEEAEKMPP